MSTENSNQQTQGQQQQAPVTPPQPGTPEYVQQMTALYDAQNGAVQPKPEGQAETKPATETPGQSGDPQGTSDKKPDEQAPKPEGEGEGEGKDGKEEGQENKDEKPLTLESFVMDPKVNEELYVKGSLSEDSYATLEKLGVPRTLAEQVATALKAAEEARVERIVTYAGGESEFSALESWAAQNLSDKEWNVLQAQIHGDGYQAAIDVLKARRQKALGEPTLHNVRGQGTQATGYASQAEMMRDMADPRYYSDPAFQAQVAQKLRNAAF